MGCHTFRYSQQHRRPTFRSSRFPVFTDGPRVAFFFPLGRSSPCTWPEQCVYTHACMCMYISSTLEITMKRLDPWTLCGFCEQGPPAAFSSRPLSAAQLVDDPSCIHVQQIQQQKMQPNTSRGMHKYCRWLFGEPGPRVALEPLHDVRSEGQVERCLLLCPSLMTKKNVRELCASAQTSKQPTT